MQELSFRLTEVQHWMRQFVQASDDQSAPTLLQVVLQHRQADPNMQLLPSSSEEELAFVEKVRRTGQTTASERINYFCNFDDSGSFVSCMVQVLRELSTGRKGKACEFNSEFLDMLDDEDNESAKYSCNCVAM